MKNWPSKVTLSKQNELKRFPVPSLQETLEKFTLSSAPFVTENELQQSKKVMEEFAKPGGQGEHLQNLLEQRQWATYLNFY